MTWLSIPSCSRPLTQRVRCGALGSVMHCIGLLACCVGNAFAGPAAPAPNQSPENWSWPVPDWEQADPGDVGLNPAQLAAARDHALTGGGSGCITRHGRLVMVWGDPHARYDLKSTTKSFGSIALGLAIADGIVRLDDPAIRHQPKVGIPPETNALSGWLPEITLFHLASQTAGFEKPGGYTPLLFRPGTAWDYSDSGPNWLAECLTLAWRRDIREIMLDRVFIPLGIPRADLAWRANAYRPHEIADIPRREFGSGISASTDALARIGYLMLREGRWQARQILPSDYVVLEPFLGPIVAATQPQPGNPRESKAATGASAICGIR